MIRPLFRPGSRYAVSVSAGRRGKIRRSLVVALGFLVASATRAAPVEADLGDGLLYFRVHEVPADLPATTVRRSPMVIDLRFVKADPPAAVALEGWLRFRATPAAPLLILVNAGTAPAVQSLLAANRPWPGLLTIGLPGAALAPDITVRVSPEADHKAYAALDDGGNLTALLTENADKPRSDEAAIIRDRANLPAEAEAGDDAEPPPAAAPTAAAPAPVIDFTLQRAVQVHRALRAWKKL